MYTYLKKGPTLSVTVFEIFRLLEDGIKITNFKGVLSCTYNRSNFVSPNVVSSGTIFQEARKRSHLVREQSQGGIQSVFLSIVIKKVI